MFEQASNSQKLLNKRMPPTNLTQDNELKFTTVQYEKPQITQIPLSIGQERLWFHEQAEAESSIYNLPIAYHLTGALNVRALEQSLREIVQRHEMMRAFFVAEDGKPVQLVSLDLPWTLQVIDLRTLSSDQRRAESHRLATEDAQTPFDLTQPPLWRFKLLHLEEYQYVLLLTIHHIISDHWSLHLLMQELAALYEAFSAGSPSPLSPLTKRYGDFVTWQREWLESGKLESQLNSWKDQLGGTVSPLKLPIDKPRSVPTYRGGRQDLLVSRELTSALKALSEKEGATLFMTLLAAFQTLLYEYTQQEDMIICSPVAGRHRPHTKGVIGYFINILPLRTSLSDDPSFRELIGRVRQVAMSAYKSMDLPFQAITDLPNLARTPLIRGAFALQHSPHPTITLPNLTIRYLDFQNAHNGTANFELSLFLEEKEGTLSGVVDYKADLFDDATIAQLIEQFQEVLECLVADPDQHLSALPRLKEAIPDEGLLGQSRSAEEPAYVAPQKEMECKIAAVWQEILQLDKVGIHHNFFDLGGHSLAISRVHLKLLELLDRKLSIVDLFRYPTISSLSQYLSQEEGTEQVTLQQIQSNAQRQKEALNRRKQLAKQRKGNG